VEFGVNGVCVDSGEGGLPGARRAPQNERKYVPLLDREAERFAFPDQMLLADEIVERLRPDPAC
jgi:hypothetical protein